MRFDRGPRGHERRRHRGLAVAGALLVTSLVAACGDDDEVAQAPSDDPEAVRGQEIFDGRCSSCHSTTGGSSTGPHLDGIYGQEVELQGGDTVVADDEYLTRSITDPTADVVDGFQPVMPDLGLSDEEVAALVAYIRSLG